MKLNINSVRVMASYSRCLLRLMAFFPLVSAFPGQAEGISILHGLNLCLEEKHKLMTNITSPGQYFVVMDENLNFQVMEGINISESTQVVTEVVGNDFKFVKDAEEMKNRVLIGIKYPKKSRTKIDRIKFETGSVTFGFIAIERKEETFDMAICLGSLKFKPDLIKRIMNEVETKSFFSIFQSVLELLNITYENARLSQLTRHLEVCIFGKYTESLENYLGDRIENKTRG